MSLNTSATSGLSYRAFAFGVVAAVAFAFSLHQAVPASNHARQAASAQPIVKLETVVVTGKRHAAPMVIAQTPASTVEQLPTVVVVGHRGALALS